MFTKPSASLIFPLASAAWPGTNLLTRCIFGQVANALLRGAFLGLMVSFAFYSSTGFQNHISFVAGILYGAIIEGWLSISKNK